MKQNPERRRRNTGPDALRAGMLAAGVSLGAASGELALEQYIGTPQPIEQRTEFKAGSAEAIALSLMKLPDDAPLFKFDNLINAYIYGNERTVEPTAAINRIKEIAAAAGNLNAGEEIRELILSRYLQAVEYEQKHSSQSEQIASLEKDRGAAAEIGKITGVE